MDYTRRIRRLQYLPCAFHFDSPDGIPMDLKALRVVRRAFPKKSEALFPNLLQLEFIQPSHAEPCLDIFLESKSISLSLHWSEETTPIGQLFSTIKKYALHLEELDLGSFKDQGAVESADLSKLTCKMQDLRGLACGCRKLTYPALLHLMNLPRLRKLQVPNTSEDILASIELSTDSRRSIFPALQHLTIRVDGLAPFATLFKRMRPLELQSLTLYLTQAPPPAELHLALLALGTESGTTSSIREVTFKYTLPQPSGRRIINPHESGIHPNIITGHTLEPLLACRNLELLHLDIACTFDLGDTQMNAMAVAWPRLRHIQLGAHRGWGSPPQVTLHGILALLGGCRELEYLALSFDATCEPPPISSISPKCINHKITYIYVGDAPLDQGSINRVGDFLQRILPNLTGIGGNWLYTTFATETRQREWGDLIYKFRSLKDCRVIL